MHFLYENTLYFTHLKIKWGSNFSQQVGSIITHKLEDGTLNYPAE